MPAKPKLPHFPRRYRIFFKIDLRPIGRKTLTVIIPNWPYSGWLLLMPVLLCLKSEPAIYPVLARQPVIRIIIAARNMAVAAKTTAAVVLPYLCSLPFLSSIAALPSAKAEKLLPASIKATCR